MAFWIPSTLLIICLAAMSMASSPGGGEGGEGSSTPPGMVRSLPVGNIPRIVRCRDPLRFPGCFLPFPCPLGCLTNCLVDCVTCKPVCSCTAPGAVCQDPRFVGGDGMTFYFHGRKDADFCLVSDSNLHVNGHFIGKRNPKLKRDFTWVQSIGVMFDNHKLLVSALRTSTWNDNVDRLAISFDGTPISIPTKTGSKWESHDSSNVVITRTSHTNGVMIEVLDNFRVTAAVVPITAEESRVHDYNITNEDCFAHLELGFRFYNLSDSVDGVLGQTYRSNYVNKAKPSAKMSVMGGAHKYSTSGLFSTDCTVSRFRVNDHEIKEGSLRQKFRSILMKKQSYLPKHYDVGCSSTGMQGNGLACK